MGLVVTARSESATAIRVSSRLHGGLSGPRAYRSIFQLNGGEARAVLSEVLSRLQMLYLTHVFVL